MSQFENHRESLIRNVMRRRILGLHPNLWLSASIGIFVSDAAIILVGRQSFVLFFIGIIMSVIGLYGSFRKISSS